MRQVVKIIAVLVIVSGLGVGFFSYLSIPKTSGGAGVIQLPFIEPKGPTLQFNESKTSVYLTNQMPYQYMIYNDWIYMGGMDYGYLAVFVGGSVGFCARWVMKTEQEIAGLFTGNDTTKLYSDAGKPRIIYGTMADGTPTSPLHWVYMFKSVDKWYLMWEDNVHTKIQVINYLLSRYIK